jgi:hypothetical protein
MLITALVPCTLYLVPCTLYLVPCTLYLVPCNGSTHDVASDVASLLRRSLQVYSRTVDLQTDLMFE